jgi:hypothetical protein
MKNIITEKVENQQNKINKKKPELWLSYGRVSSSQQVKD